MTGESWRRMWADQAEFNTNFRISPAPTYEQRTADTKEMVLHLFSEADELLRASGAWKPHRRQTVKENPRHVQYELIDMLKYWMTVCQIHGFTPEEMEAAYWEKSMIVRQRYSQEFVQTMTEPCIVMDLDNVIADYITGFVHWLSCSGYIADNIREIALAKHGYLMASDLGLSTVVYERAKHEYRISGEHALLPEMPGVQEFFAWVVARGLKTIILTSRPIDQYPNLYGETLQWLERHAIPYTAVWWASNKGTAIALSRIAPFVQFAVDDEYGFVEQFCRQEIRTYWLDQIGGIRKDKYLTIVKTLADIIEEEKKRE